MPSTLERAAIGFADTPYMQELFIEIGRDRATKEYVEKVNPALMQFRDAILSARRMMQEMAGKKGQEAKP